MEAVNNFASCLKLLENQGFQAEHRLLVQLLGCIETYWNRPNAGNLDVQRDTLKSPNVGSLDIQRDTAAKSSLIEEEDIELVNDIFFSNQDLGGDVNGKYPSEVKSEKGPKKKRKRGKIREHVTHNKDKNDQVAELEVSNAIDEYSLERKGTRRRIPRNSKVNPEVTLSRCKYCPFRIPGSFVKIRFKLRMHNKAEHFVCEICEKKHDNKDELDMHMNSLHKDVEGKVICGVNGCDRKLKQLYNILEHVRLCHKRVADRICKECDKPYLKIRRHRRQHHIDPSALKTCEECGFTSLTKSNLIVHIRLRHPKQGKFSRKFSCASCDFETNGLSQDEEFKLIMHKRIHQSGEIICTMCPYKSEKPWSLKRHLAKEHNIGYVFQCNQCDYKTGGPTAKGHMKTHMARHSNEKNFICDQCEFSGNTTWALQKHLQRHNPDMPKYLCNECDYKSTDSGNFKAHKQVKHGSVVLSCEDCEYSTKSTRSLREHNKKQAHFPHLPGEARSKMIKLN